MLDCISRIFRSPRVLLYRIAQELATDLLAGHLSMPSRSPVTLSPDRSAALVEEAVRRINASISDCDVNLAALRQALATEMAKGPLPLIKLMKLGRRRALDRINRMARKEAKRADQI